MVLSTLFIFEPKTCFSKLERRFKISKLVTPLPGVVGEVFLFKANCFVNSLIKKENDGGKE